MDTREWNDEDKLKYLVCLLMEMAKWKHVASVLTRAPRGPVSIDFARLIRDDFLEADLVEFMKKHDIVFWMKIEVDDQMPMLFISRCYMNAMFKGRW